MYQTYLVTWVNGQVQIKKRRGLRPYNRSFIIENFIYGNGSYIDETRKFPDYVHQQVWELFNVNRKT
jgi:hypothetical protein